MTPEGKIKAKLNRRLDALARMYRFMPVQNGMGKPGLDYFICAGGWFIAIETKAPGKKPTPRQEATMQDIVDAHGLVFVVDGDESLERAMKTIEACCMLADDIRADKVTHEQPSVREVSRPANRRRTNQLPALGSRQQPDHRGDDQERASPPE